MEGHKMLRGWGRTEEEGELWRVKEQGGGQRRRRVTGLGEDRGSGG